MSSAINLHHITLVRNTPSTAFASIAALIIALVAIAVPARAQTDNFDNGSDAAWQKSATADYPATFTFVPDVFGGKAYNCITAHTSSLFESDATNWAEYTEFDGWHPTWTTNTAYGVNDVVKYGGIV